MTQSVWYADLDSVWPWGQRAPQDSASDCHDILKKNTSDL